mgnify:CR=1 FL=1
MNRVVIPVLVISAAVILGLSTLRLWLGSHDPSKETSTETAEEEDLVGTILPDFPIQVYGEPSASALSAHLGKVTLINFWATWCEACIVEMPSIRKLRAAFHSRGFEVLAVSLDENPSEVLPKAIKEFGLDFGIFLDPDQKISDHFDVHAIPFTAVIAHDRRILFTESGERDWNSKEVHDLMQGWLKAP